MTESEVLKIFENEVIILDCWIEHCKDIIADCETEEDEFDDDKERVEQQRERERNKLSPDVLKLMRPLNNHQIEDKTKELSVSEQRMIAEENARPAPKGMIETVSKRLYD